MGRKVRQQTRAARPAGITPAGGCSGIQLDHRDGSMSCSRGENCPSVALPHRGWGDCASFGPCDFCEGPPVTWICDRS